MSLISTTTQKGFCDEKVGFYNGLFLFEILHPKKTRVHYLLNNYVHKQGTLITILQITPHTHTLMIYAVNYIKHLLVCSL